MLISEFEDGLGTLFPHSVRNPADLIEEQAEELMDITRDDRKFALPRINGRIRLPKKVRKGPGPRPKP